MLDLVVRPTALTVSTVFKSSQRTQGLPEESCIDDRCRGLRDRDSYRVAPGTLSRASCTLIRLGWFWVDPALGV